MKSSPAHLRDLTLQLQQWADDVSNKPGVAAKKNVLQAVSLILQANQFLREHADQLASPEWTAAVSAYRNQMECLLKKMPQLRSQLNAEKARLEAEQKRIHATKQWAESVR